jgi:hypothetical protein
MQIKREFAVIVYQSGMKIGDGPKHRLFGGRVAPTC